MQDGLGLRVYWIALVLVGCDAKEHAKDILREYVAPSSAPRAAAPPVTAAAATATASAASAPSAAPAASAAPEPAAPALAQLFDGEASLAGGTRAQATYGGRGTTIGVPKGWKAYTEGNAGLVTVTSADGLAAAFMHDFMGGVIDGSVNFWSNRAGFDHKGKVSWDKELVSGKYGADHLDVKIGTGRGELRKKPATFYHVRLPKDVLVAGALADDAPPERKLELIEVLKSLHPFEKKPKPEQ